MPGKFDLKSRDLIKIWLFPDPDDKDKKAKKAAEPVALGSTDAGKVESLEARGAVHMIALDAVEDEATTDPKAKPKPAAPLSKRTMDARDLLVVVFDPPPEPKPAAAPVASNSATTQTVAQTDKPVEPEDEAAPKNRNRT